MCAKKVGAKAEGFDALAASIMKKAKGVHVSIMSESDIASRGELIPTPSYDLNRILSGNFRDGVPVKTWTQIVGPEHSFKSSFMALMLSKCQAKDMNIIVIDTEGAWDPEFIKRWGCDPDKVLYVYTPTVEDCIRTLAQIKESDMDRFAIVIDSIGGLMKEKVQNDASDGTPKADQGGLARTLKDMYKLLLWIIKSKNSIAFSGGHFVGSPNSYGGADEIGGGKAAKYLPDIIISLKRLKLFDANRNVIGNELKAICLKNRMYPPYNEAIVHINFEEGLNRFAGLKDIAEEAGIVQKAGAWYSYNGDKVQGETRLNELFERNEEQFINDLNEYIKSTGFSTLNEAIELREEELKELEASMGEAAERFKKKVTAESAD